MKKDPDITRPRYSEQILPVRPLTLRYFEVSLLYLESHGALIPHPHPLLYVSALFYGYLKLHEKGKKGGIWGQNWGSNSGSPAQKASQESFKEEG